MQVFLVYYQYGEMFGGAFSTRALAEARVNQLKDLGEIDPEPTIEEIEVDALVPHFDEL